MIRAVPWFRLAAVVMACCPADPAGAAEPSELVVLLHPKMKDWEPLIVKDKRNLDSSSWAVWAYKPKDKPRVVDRAVRFEVGVSAKDVKDWSLMIQFETPKQGMTPNGLQGVIVPFVVRYRESADVKPIELARGAVWDSGDNSANAVKNLCGTRVRSIGSDITLSTAGRILVDKPRFEQDGGTPFAFAPTKLDLKANPPTASVKLHNRLPLPAAAFIEFQGKFTPASGDQIFRMKDNKGQYVSVIMEAGEEKTVTFELKDLKKGQEPRWCKLTSVDLLFPVPAVEK